jgi:hypothetical protein
MMSSIFCASSFLSRPWPPPSRLFFVSVRAIRFAFAIAGIARALLAQLLHCPQRLPDRGLKPGGISLGDQLDP